MTWGINKSLKIYNCAKEAPVNISKLNMYSTKLDQKSKMFLSLKAGYTDDTLDISRGIYNKNLLPQQEWIT